MPIIDRDRIVGCHWDESTARKRVDQHGVNRSETEEIFWNEPLVIVGNVGHSRSELRFHALDGT